MSRAWVEIDLDAIAQNVSTLGALAPSSELCAVVKANAYGHGAVEVARTALDAGASKLAVAQVAEGRLLREAGIDAPIWLFSEPSAEEYPVVVASGLEPSLYTAEAIERAGAAVGDHDSLTVHLAVDTGMGRVGVTNAEALALAQSIDRADGLDLGSVWTHLARADEVGHSLNEQQLDRFDALLDELDAAGIDVPMAHAANTAATITLPRSHRDVVRCGIGIYGCLPSPDFDDLVDLRPALRLVSEIAFLKRVRAGTAVSYGHRRTLTRDATLATIPVGYADGVPRAWWDAGQVLINGQRHGFAGMVTMDQVIVDCGDAEIALGDEVVLLGPQAGDAISAEEWAEVLGTISYEIVCGFGARLDRIYRGRT